MQKNLFATQLCIIVACFFLVLEHVFVFFISIKIHKFCLGIFLSFLFFAHFVKIQRRSSHSSIILLTSVFFFFVFTDSEKSGRKIFVCLSACLRGDISLWMRYVVIKDSTENYDKY